MSRISAVCCELLSTKCQRSRMWNFIERDSLEVVAHVRNESSSISIE